MNSASWAVQKTSGTPPAAVQSSSSGIGIATRSCTIASSPCPPPPTIAITPSPTSNRRTSSPIVDDLAGELEPRDVRRRAGRRRIAARELMHVGAVEARRVHADEQLTGLRLGIWMLFDGDLAVANRGGTHGSRCYP